MATPQNQRGDGRRQPQPRGQPAGGVTQGNRNDRRAYEFQQAKNLQENWSEVRDFEERPQKNRGPTTRSTNWKQSMDKKKSEKLVVKTDAAAAYDFRAKDETAPVDEPMYDLGPHSSSIPVQETYSQNFEFGGFIDQIERTYESLRGIDPRLDRRMPFSMFQHSMSTILNCYLMDLTLENGERRLDAAKCQELLPEDLCIPENLYHYIVNVGNTTTVNGEEVKFNLPAIAIPQPADGDIPSGTFGVINAENHNVYECYIAPLITANRVLNTRRAQGEPEIPPLPLNLVPAGAVPNVNLLGHGPPDVLPAEARPRIEGFEFPNGESTAARLKICPELMSRVNTVLFELRSRFKMRDIGRKSPEIRNYLTPKTIPGNIQFVRVPEHTPDGQKLTQRQCQVRSSSSFGSSSAGFCNVTVYHRERLNNSRGPCYTIAGAIPPGWLATINNNFNMVGVFGPIIGANNPAIRVTKFISHSPGGTRITAIDNYVKRNFYIPAK